MMEAGDRVRLCRGRERVDGTVVSRDRLVADETGHVLSLSVAKREGWQIEVMPPLGSLRDEDGFPILENASMDDIQMAIAAAGPLARYGNFIRASLAGIYAERERARCGR